MTYLDISCQYRFHTLNTQALVSLIILVPPTVTHRYVKFIVKQPPQLLDTSTFYREGGAHYASTEIQVVLKQPRFILKVVNVFLNYGFQHVFIEDLYVSMNPPFLQIAS